MEKHLRVVEAQDTRFSSATRIAQSIGEKGKETGRYDRLGLGKYRFEISQYHLFLFGR